VAWSLIPLYGTREPTQTAKRHGDWIAPPLNLRRTLAQKACSAHPAHVSRHDGRWPISTVKFISEL